MSKRWRFIESGETGVYTTRQVLDEGALLAIVAHDLDGDWQFLHDEDDDEQGDLRDEDDLLFVPLQEIVDRFPEVSEVADLLPGWFAHRLALAGPWVRAAQPTDWSAD